MKNLLFILRYIDKMTGLHCRQNGMFFRQGGKLVVNSDDTSETLCLCIFVYSTNEINILFHRC